MRKFRKRPLEIEAIQLTWENWEALCEFANVGSIDEHSPEGTYINPVTGKPTSDVTGELGLLIPTLEGIMLAREGDWIIRGVQGELYPCKPDIFEQTYEQVAA